MEHADQPVPGNPRSRTGDRLRAAREAQGLSLDEVSTHTRVPKRLLELIEKGDHAPLPATTYSAGFVKVYAQLVGLDAVELSRQFRDEIGRSGGPSRRIAEPFEPADPARVPSRLLAYVALAVAILVALGYAAWRGGSLWGYGADERARLAAGTEAPAVQAPSPATAPPARAPVSTIATPVPVAAPVAAALPPQALGAPVVLTATDTVWLKVYERGGATLYTGEMPAGRSYAVPADAVDPLLRTVRPEALQITVGGRPIAPLGAPSTLVHDASLKPEALAARAGGGGPAPEAISTPARVP